MFAFNARQSFTANTPKRRDVMKPVYMNNGDSKVKPPSDSTKSTDSSKPEKPKTAESK